MTLPTPNTVCRRRLASSGQRWQAATSPCNAHMAASRSTGVSCGSARTAATCGRRSGMRTADAFSSSAAIRPAARLSGFGGGAPRVVAGATRAATGPLTEAAAAAAAARPGGRPAAVRMPGGTAGAAPSAPAATERRCSSTFGKWVTPAAERCCNSWATARLLVMKNVLKNSNGCTDRTMSSADHPRFLHPCVPEEYRNQTALATSHPRKTQLRSALLAGQQESIPTCFGKPKGKPKVPCTFGLKVHGTCRLIFSGTARAVR